MIYYHRRKHRRFINANFDKIFGIVIRLYFQQAEHNPPHVHALYGDDMAEVVIQSGEVLEGHLPPKALAMVREWVDLHQGDLLEMWETQEFKKLPPLE